MRLRNTIAKIGCQYNKSLKTFPYFFSRKAEQSVSYKEYLDEGVRPESHYNNSNNLFDDSNSKDRKWLKLAMKHLDKASR